IKDKILTVVAPLKDTPAYRAGIKSGDKILKIDQTTTVNLTIDEAVKLIRGERGTEIILTIARDGEKEPREIKIIRDIGKSIACSNDSVSSMHEGTGQNHQSPGASFHIAPGVFLLVK
ncbi:MAG: PDZ domain-containing protein, partial [Candidatus Taylorbacteria bacterium]|nr:PDZ domain-containing protein [Candidatus Taylorbacteria bacterium]